MLTPIPLSPGRAAAPSRLTHGLISKVQLLLRPVGDWWQVQPSTHFARPKVRQFTQCMADNLDTVRQRAGKLSTLLALWSAAGCQALALSAECVGAEC